VPGASSTFIGEDGVVTEQPAAPQQPTTAPRPKRGRETVRDMVLSLTVVLAVVAVVLLVGMRDEPQQQIREIGYAEKLAQAREVASYDVLAPVGLGVGWKATSARGLEGNGAVTWHLGFVTPDGHYAAVEQSDGAARSFLNEHVAGAQDAGRVRLGSDQWQKVEGGTPEVRALVLRGEAQTTLVAGSATWAELTALATALRGS
jgi:Protein of unknown function (DUF4245)